MIQALVACFEMMRCILSCAACCDRQREPVLQNDYSQMDREMEEHPYTINIIRQID